VDGKTFEEVNSWGVHRLVLPAGKRKFEAWARFASGLNYGRCSQKVAIPEGGTVELTYISPATPGPAGRIDVS